MSESTHPQGPADQQLGASQVTDEELAWFQRAYERRVSDFQELSGLRTGQFVAPVWAVPFVPAQDFEPGPDPRVAVRAPANVRPEFSLHPVYFCDPELMSVFDTDGGSRDRYALRVFHLLRAWGLARSLEEDSDRPLVARVDEYLGLRLTPAELAQHLRGERTRLSDIYFGRESLNPPLSQVLSEVWEELEQCDPEGNARLRAEREGQKARLAQIERLSAHQAACREYEKRSGLLAGEYADNQWGFPFVPFVEARTGETRDVLVQAPPHVELSFLGHPVFWCDPSITAPMAIDGTAERYCLRMYYTLSALGMIRPDRSLDDVLEDLGPQANDAARRNHLRGRQTPLDAVFITWEAYGQCTRRHVLEVVWEQLEELDPEGNARLADAWQEVLDLWEYEDQQEAKAEAVRQVHEKARRKQARRQLVRDVVDTARDVSDALAERSAQKQAAYEHRQKMLARQIYIDNNRRR